MSVKTDTVCEKSEDIETGIWTQVSISIIYPTKEQ